MAQATVRKISGYEVERELAEGGMGVVYLAHQPSLDRLVVLKRMRRELAQDEEFEERFRREARLAASIHHPNVVGVYDCFQWRGEPYIACEYVDGLDAASALEKCKQFPPRIAALVALEVARGLQELHSRALVHRDLKPGNVLLGRDGSVKITDFGVAHDARSRGLTRSGVSLGTPAYMPPEQLRGERVDARSDLFAFGVMVYELVCGRLPFAVSESTAEQALDGPSLLQRMESASFESLGRARRGTPRALTRLVKQALQPKAKRRVSSAAEVCRRLERWVGTNSPAVARAEIAAWLAEAKLLPAKGRTRRAKRAKEESATPWPRRWVALAAAIAGLMAAAATLPAWPRVEAAWNFAREWPEGVGPIEGATDLPR